MKISQSKVDALMADMKENIPDLKIIYKDEPMPTWWLKVLDIFIQVLGIFNKGFKEKWYNNISNGIGGRWIIFPKRETHEDLSQFHVYSTLRHEYVHLLDQRKQPVWFHLTYLLLPLPLFYTGRAHWECRGYAQDLLTEFEVFGKITETSQENVKKFFTGSLYFWMWKNKKQVEERIGRIVKGIEEGEYTGFYPDISWFR